MFFFGTNVLHFSEEFYGTVLLIDGIAQVIGSCVTCLHMYVGHVLANALSILLFVLVEHACKFQRSSSIHQNIHRYARACAIFIV